MVLNMSTLLTHTPLAHNIHSGISVEGRKMNKTTDTKHSDTAERKHGKKRKKISNSAYEKKLAAQQIELVRLQEIMFYRDVGLSLDEVGRLLDGPANAVERLIRHRRRMTFTRYWSSTAP